jgi:hypothetical protein
MNDRFKVTFYHPALSHTWVCSFDWRDFCSICENLVILINLHYGSTKVITVLAFGCRLLCNNHWLVSVLCFQSYWSVPGISATCHPQCFILRLLVYGSIYEGTVFFNARSCILVVSKISDTIGVWSTTELHSNKPAGHITLSMRHVKIQVAFF